MALSRADVARVKHLKDSLGSFRGWYGPHTYFNHSSGKVPLREASGVYNIALELIKIAEKAFPGEEQLLPTS